MSQKTKNIKITEEAHKQLKIRAAIEGLTLSELILKLLEKA